MEIKNMKTPKKVRLINFLKYTNKAVFNRYVKYCHRINPDFKLDLKSADLTDGTVQQRSEIKFTDRQ